MVTKRIKPVYSGGGNDLGLKRKFLLLCNCFNSNNNFGGEGDTNEQAKGNENEDSLIHLKTFFEIDDLSKEKFSNKRNNHSFFFPEKRHLFCESKNSN